MRQGAHDGGPRQQGLRGLLTVVQAAVSVARAVIILRWMCSVASLKVFGSATTSAGTGIAARNNFV